MSTDNKLKEIKLRLQLIMLLRKLNKIYAHDKAISSDEPKWITVHPHGKGAINKNGEDIKGTPVLLESETGEVLGGMGGKYNGVHISEACSKENTLNTQHDIKRGQMMRENPQKFAAEQKAREQKAQQHLKDLQDTAKKETAKEQQKAKEKQDQIKEQQDQAKETQTQEQTKSPIQNLSKTSTEHEINAALDSIQQIKIGAKGMNSQQRTDEVIIKREAIKNLYKVDNKIAAKAFKARLEAAGPPPAAFNNFNEAREYAHKLLPHANICFDNVDVKTMAPIMQGTYKVLNEFPALGKFITNIGDSKTLAKYPKAVLPHAYKYQARYQEIQKQQRDFFNSEKVATEVRNNITKITQLALDDAVKQYGDTISKNTEWVAGDLAKRFGMHTGYRGAIRNCLEKISPDDLASGKMNDNYLNAVHDVCNKYLIDRETNARINQEVREGKTPPNYLSGQRDSIHRYGVVPSYNTRNVFGYCHMNTLINESRGKTTGHNSGVQLVHHSYSDSDQMTSEMKGAERSGFHPVTELSGAEAVMIHELGHSIDFMLASGLDAETLSDSKEIKKIFRDAKKIDPTKTANQEYWRTNTKELIAESVAAMLGGASDKAPQFMHDTFEIVKKMYKERFE